jgi:hypothetical protein
MLARKMGASDLHAVMAAGLAGGIGLSGRGCGALGAAIWITGMNSIKQGGKMEFKSPAARAVIERFSRYTGSTFRCADIVGRRFESVRDHARFLREGGCSEIIDVLASG